MIDESKAVVSVLGDDERAELDWLRAENAFLRAQCDALVSIAGGYARDMEVLLRRTSRR
ncbi:hypothetical protein GCM10022243_35010 [Saccharothrix violaceirubra]|uniref:Uncharacterized protein n=1 Tax=Saccharothrix violaceirubra TaxID=413306 RepID=A0A7W7T4Q2_9PSEU|nr:hypothetical protein [Saccharothrix violaceirubra]MBB4966553.1 hypothetical protein [Saccharothrix violaceirubra]